MATINTRIVLCNDSSLAWGTSDKVLLKGELGIEFSESGAPKIKVGDGTNTFADLQYLTLTPAEIQDKINSMITSTSHTHTNKAILDQITAAFTTALKNNYDAAYTHSQEAHAPADAEANVQSDWNETSTDSDAYIKNKPVLGTASGKNIEDFATAAQGAKADTAVQTIKIGGAAQTKTNGEVDLPAYPTKSSLGLNNVDNTSDADKPISDATQAALDEKADKATTLAGYGITDAASKNHQHTAADITSVNASAITGIINIENLPQGALERLTIVEDDTARFALTTDNVQLGDIVKVTESNKMYYIKDVDNLDNETGYEPFSASTASSVPWAGVTGKPSTFTPSEHTHDIDDVTGLQDALDSKADDADLTAHTGNSTIHITGTERTNWNAAKTHADSAHARVDATAVEKSNTNGNIKINGTETTVYSHPTQTAKASGLYKITTDGTGHVTAGTIVTKTDITDLGIPASDTGVTAVTANNGLTQSISGRTLTIGIGSVSTDLLANGSDVLVLSGGSAATQ